MCGHHPRRWPDPMSALKLMDWKVPCAEQTYSRRDTAFYALSLGLGRRPHDRRELRLVDPADPGLLALPSMALVLAYPGFWLGAPEVEAITGIAPWQVLHVEQRVQLEYPIPVEGSVASDAVVTAVVDKGVDKGCLLYSERRIREVAGGALLATCTQVHFLRHAGGCGSAGHPPQDIAEKSGSDRIWAHTVDTPTLGQQALLYRLNGDFNPLHSDPRVAARAGFERPVLHGMCTTGIAVTAVIEALSDLDPSGVKGFSVRMSSPVIPGDTLRHRIASDGGFETQVAESGKTTLTMGKVEWHD